MCENSKASMMLTTEQLRELRSKVAFWSELKRKDAISLFDHIDAQQARIAGLEAALAEWKSLRDPNVLHVNLLRGIPARLSADQLLHIAGDKYQAMAARIAELEAHLTRIQRLADCGTVQNWLALPDEDKARWFAVTAQRDSEHCKMIAELEQGAAAERERIKAICGNVIDEWFNCAGGADEVLRRIEEMESDK